MSYYIPTKKFSPIRALVRVHEAKISNSHYLIKEFNEFTGNQNTPSCFGVLRDRPQVLYIFGKLVNPIMLGGGAIIAQVLFVAPMDPEGVKIEG